MNPELLTRPGRPKSEEKRAAILQAASDLFLAKGLPGTSMDAVAECAGVSKQTVYSHFANKEELFRTCIINKVETYGFATADLPKTSDDLKTGLIAIGRQFLDLIFDDEVVAMFRIVIGESAVHHKIAELFYEAGPGKAANTVAGYLEQQMQQGRLKTDDPYYAAALFLNMVRAHFQMQLLMSMPINIDHNQLDQHVRKVVDQFLQLYGV